MKLSLRLATSKRGIRALAVAQQKAPTRLLYHVSPYARTVLKEGWKLSPTATWGDHQGPYIVVTELEPARARLWQLKLLVGVANGRVGWAMLAKWIDGKAGVGAFDNALTDHMANKWARTKNYAQWAAANGGYADDPTTLIKAWRKLALKHLDPTARVLTPEENAARMWDVLRRARGYASVQAALPTMTTNLPSALQAVSNKDPGIIECAVPQRKPDTTSIDTLHGKVVYDLEKQEWHFYDASDLTPLRLVK